MKTFLNFASLLVVTIILLACGKAAPELPSTAGTAVHAGQSAVQDEESQKNIVQTAVRSDSHQTLVAALKAADYVNALSNAGPFTVFAPTDDAFGQLPQGTVEDLVKAENKLKLQDILEYHVYVGVIRESMVQSSLTLNQVNGKNVTLTKTGSGMEVNGAKVVATILASNGIIYVIDRVLLP